MAEPLESAARAAYEASWMNVEPPLPWGAINDEDRARCYAVARAVIGVIADALEEPFREARSSIRLLDCALDDLAIETGAHPAPGSG